MGAVLCKPWGDNHSFSEFVSAKLCHIQKTSFMSSTSPSWALILSASSSTILSELCGVLQLPAREDCFTCHCSGHVAQLWVSVLTIACYSKKLLWWSLVTALICGYKRVFGRQFSSAIAVGSSLGPLTAKPKALDQAYRNRYELPWSRPQILLGSGW